MKQPYEGEKSPDPGLSPNFIFVIGPLCSVCDTLIVTTLLFFNF